jgi:Trypsin-like peptidase domain
MAAAGLDPREVIVPIIGHRAGENRIHYLGTGSIIGDASVLLTADHVLRGWDDAADIGIVTPVSNGPVDIEVIERDTRHDLALLEVSDYRPPNFPPLSVDFDLPVFTSVPVLTSEYASTEFVDEKLRFTPAMRLGNITRTHNMTDRFGPAGEDALELSFPARS